MHTMSSYQNSGSKITKIAIVTMLHVGFVLAMLGMRGPAHEGGEEPGLVMVDPPVKTAEPPPPPPTVDAPPPTALPPIFVPPSAVATVNPEAPKLTTTTELPTEPVPPIPGPKVIAEVAPPPVAKVVEPKVFRAAQTGNCALPNYPAQSARNGDEGVVGLDLLIAPDGRVTDAKVTSTSGHRELDRAAIAALSLCSFKPATANGVPEAAWGKIAYEWTLTQ